MKNSNSHSKKIFIIATTLGIVLLVLGLFFRSQKNQQEAVVESQKSQAEFIRPHNFSKGNPNAKVVVVEFYDPECEACKAFHPVMNQIFEKYKDQIKFVPRPIALHSSSDMAIRVSYAAGKQNKFFEMFDLLFEKQDEWGHKEFPPLDLFMKYSASLGLNVEMLRKDMDFQTIIDDMRLDAKDASLLNVRGTPTVFVNMKLLNNLSLDSLNEMIQLELNKN